MSSSHLVTLGLSGVIAGILLTNFQTYEQFVPEWYFQGAFMFDIFYQNAMKSKDLTVSTPKFFAISFFKRFHKFIILSVLYFGKFIRDTTIFYYILIVFILVGTVFYLVPLKFWTHLMENIFPFRLILCITNFIQIGADVRFIFSITIQKPDKLAIFNNPEVEFLLISFVMGTLAPLIDNSLVRINLSKKEPISKIVLSSCNWGFSGILAYLVHEYYYLNILPMMAYYKIFLLYNKMELIRRIHLLYFCLLGGFYSSTRSHNIPNTRQIKKVVKERQIFNEEQKNQTSIDLDDNLRKTHDDLSNNSKKDTID